MSPADYLEVAERYYIVSLLHDLRNLAVAKL